MSETQQDAPTATEVIEALAKAIPTLHHPTSHGLHYPCPGPGKCSTSTALDLYRRWQAAQQDQPQTAPIHYAPYGPHANYTFDCGAKGNEGYTGDPQAVTCLGCKRKSPGLWPEAAEPTPTAAERAEKITAGWTGVEMEPHYVVTGHEGPNKVILSPAYAFTKIIEAEILAAEQAARQEAERERDELDCTLADEIAAHQETLLMLKAAEAEVARLRELLNDVAELRAAIKILLARDRPSTPWHHVSEKDVDGYQEFARERLKRRPQAAQQVAAPTAQQAYRKWRDKMADKGVKPPMHPYHPYIDGYNDALAAEQAARQEAETKCKQWEERTREVALNLASTMLRAEAAEAEVADLKADWQEMECARDAAEAEVTQPRDEVQRLQAVIGQHEAAACRRHTELVQARESIELMAERVAAQSELLSKRATDGKNTTETGAPQTNARPELH